MPTKSSNITFTLGGGRELSPEQFSGQVGRWLQDTCFPPEVWRNFGASLSKFVREEGEKVRDELVENIINRWWQRDINDNPVYGLDAIDNPKSPPGLGKRLIETLSELDISVEKETTSRGFESTFSMNLQPLIQDTASNARNHFPYIFAQEFGNLQFDGKHFIFDEDGEGIHPEDNELFMKLVERVKTRIRSSIRKGRSRS